MRSPQRYAWQKHPRGGTCVKKGKEENNMKHRTLSILLALVFLLSVFMFSATAFAASNTADGLTAVLESDKDAYVAGDKVGVSLTVTNTSEDITNIRTELVIPQGLDLVEGQLISDAMNLTVGESAEYSYVLSVPVVEIPTTQAPTTQAPTTQAPTTPAPTVPAPTTQTPTTQNPTTQVPTTDSGSGDVSPETDRKSVV